MWELRPVPGLVTEHDLVIGGQPPVLARLGPHAHALLAGDPTEPGDPAATALLRLGLAELATAAAPEWEPPITIVIPVKDNAVGVTELLAGLRAGSVDVLVVDDGSEPAEAAALAALAQPGRGGSEPQRAPGPHGPQVTVLRHETNRGPAAARNTGWRAAGTELVAFLDADIVAGPGWWEPLVDSFADPRLALAAPRIVAAEPAPGDSAARGRPDLDGALGRYEAGASPLDRGPVGGPVGPGRPHRFVVSAALLCRRGALVDVGGFDESYRFGEDTDFCARLTAAGWAARYVPAATVAHRHRTAWRSFLTTRYRYGTPAARLAARHGGALPVADAAGYVAAAAGVVGVVGASPPVLAGAAAAGAAGAGRSVALLVNAGVPARVAVAVAARLGLGGARRFAGSLARQPTLPLALCAGSLAPRRFRAARAVVPLAVTALWARERRAQDVALPLPGYLALRLADELAASLGVLAGCRQQRSARALRPDVAVLPRRPGRAGGAGTPGHVSDVGDVTVLLEL